MVVGFVYGVWFVLLVFGSCLFNVLDFCCWGGLWFGFAGLGFVIVDFNVVGFWCCRLIVLCISLVVVVGF